MEHLIKDCKAFNDHFEAVTSTCDVQQKVDKLLLMVLIWMS